MDCISIAISVLYMHFIMIKEENVGCDCNSHVYHQHNSPGDPSHSRCIYIRKRKADVLRSHCICLQRMS